MSVVRGAVVYYSRYGNNEKTAEGVAQGLREAGHEVELVNLKANKELAPGYDFLVVGSPTRGGRNSGPVRKFIKKNVGEQWRGKPFAAFGTCMHQTCEKGQPSAAGEIHTELEARGMEPLADSFDNPVSGMKGPLAADGEERARSFGREAGEKLRG